MIHSNPADWALFDNVKTLLTGGGAIGLFSFSPPVNRDAELVIFTFTYNCDATAADRYFHLYLDAPATEQTLGFTTTPLTANQICDIAFGQGLDRAVMPGNTHMTIPIPTRLRIAPNSTLYLDILNNTAGDLFASPVARWNMQIKTNL